MSALLLLTSLLPVLLLAALLLRRERAVVRDANVALLEARVDEIGHTLEAMYGGYRASAARGARHRELVAYFSEPTDRRASMLPVLYEHLHGFRGDDPGIRGVGVVDRNGTVLAATESALVGASIAYREYFQRALVGAEAQSDIYISIAATGLVPSIAFTAPIHDGEGEVLGVYILWIRADTLWDVMRAANDTAGRGSFFTIFDRHGIRVAHSRNEEVLFHPGAPLPTEVTRALIADRRFQARTAELLASVVPFPLEEIQHLGRGERRTFSRANSPANGLTNLAVARSFPVLGATVIGAVPEGEIEVRLASVLPRVLPALLAGIVMVIVGSGLLMRRVVHPIRRLAGAAAALERGEFAEPGQARAFEAPQDEIGALTRAFRSMVKTLAERDQIRAELQQAQKMEAVGRLASGVAHDFNNLLVVILSGSSFLLEELPAGHPLRGEVGEIKEAGQRAARLVAQLLAFARKSPGRPVRTELNAVVLGIEKLVRRAVSEDTETTLALAPDALPIRIDPGQLEQVIVNLAVNARHAMPDGGRLRIETSGEDGSATGDGRAARRSAILRVSDTGCGMTPEVAARIFEPFFTTKGQGRGTGLGLSSAFGIVRQAGGDIAVESAPGRGSTFTIRLPFCTSEAGDEDAERSLPAPCRAAERAS